MKLSPCYTRIEVTNLLVLPDQATTVPPLHQSLLMARTPSVQSSDSASGQKRFGIFRQRIIGTSNHKQLLSVVSALTRDMFEVVQRTV